MIDGAHIKRPVSGIESYCPSIATVVACIDKKALPHPVSYQVQPTFEKYNAFYQNVIVGAENPHYDDKAPHAERQHKTLKAVRKHLHLDEKGGSFVDDPVNMQDMWYI
jgi:hypothetical protein